MERDHHKYDDEEQKSVSIHAPRMEHDAVLTGDLKVHVRVSIHAPRMERDVLKIGNNYLTIRVSIHAPRMERDICPCDEN